MRVQRWLLVPLVLALLGVVVPAYANDNPAVIDRGRNVYEVDGRKGEIANLLPAEDVEKIKRLQTGTAAVQLLSRPSPDDAAVLAGIGNTLGFLSLADGDVVPVDTRVFGRVLPLGLLGRAGGSFWLNERILGVIGVDLDDISFGLIAIDRVTGEVDLFAIPGYPQGEVPIAAAPNGRYLLFARLAGQEGSGEGRIPRVARVPSTWPQPFAMPRPAVLEGLAQQADAFLQRRPRLSGLMAWSEQLQDDEGDDALALAEEATLFALDTESGEQRDLRTFPLSTGPVSFGFTPDGTRVAGAFLQFLDYRSEPDARAERLPYDGARISEQVYRDVTGNLPPAENPLLQGNTIETFELATGEHKVLRAADGDGSLLLFPSWSTDNQTLMVEAQAPGRVAGRRHPVYSPQFIEGLSLRFLNPQLQEVGRFVAPQISSPSTVNTFISPDELLMVGQNGTDTHPYYYNRVTGEFRNLADRAGYYAGVVATRLSRQIVYVQQSVTEPPEIYRKSWNGNGLARLTWVNEELRQSSGLRQEPVAFTLRNGQVRRGFLVQPADAPFPPRNRPVVVWQEGGPGGVMYNAWVGLVEIPYTLLPNFGFSVLVVPLSGRWGLGPRAYSALYDRNNFGQVDIDEQAEIARQMIARGWTSASKLGITGCSYGGYFVWQSIIRHPDLYAAANPQCALVDSMVEWNRGYAALMPYIQGLPPWNALEEYRKDSPIFNAGRVRAAVLSFHGTRDFLPITLNENIHLQTVNRNVPAKMLKFVLAGHGLVSVAPDPEGGDVRLLPRQYEAYAAQEQILWFRQYLK
jgi:dipeptidyl aminopeptidase/acylaminoacyl peptidase